MAKSRTHRGNPKKGKLLSIRIPDAAYEKLCALAEKECRSATGQARHVLTRWIATTRNAKYLEKTDD